MKNFAFIAAAAVLVFSGFANADSEQPPILLSADASRELFMKMDQSPNVQRNPGYETVVLTDGTTECTMKNAHGANSDNATFSCVVYR